MALHFIFTATMYHSQEDCSLYEYAKKLLKRFRRCACTRDPISHGDIGDHRARLKMSTRLSQDVYSTTEPRREALRAALRDAPRFEDAPQPVDDLLIVGRGCRSLHCCVGIVDCRRPCEQWEASFEWTSWPSSASFPIAHLPVDRVRAREALGQ